MLPICPHCGEVLSKKEIKRLIPVSTGRSNFEELTVDLWHVECWQRNLCGGLNHLKKLCFCHGGSLPPDPPEMTLREAARAAVKFWKELINER